jgi:4-hydroxy-tetrahydrodipicolinate synthase
MSELMPIPQGLSRRECLTTLLALPLISRLGLATSADDPGPTTLDGKPMRGAFMILHTPFTTDGAVDWDDLAREAQFVDRAGAHGVVWPQGSSGLATLTRGERLKGMEVLADAMHGHRAVLTLGVQGATTAAMLEYVERAEALGADAMIAMPPTEARGIPDYRTYFRALGGATRRPVIVQTSGGVPDLAPPVDLIVDLAREFPHLGHVKEESTPLVERMRAEVAAKPPLRAVFGANLGEWWLYQMRLGADGVITGNAMYADLMATLWALHENGRERELRDAYAAFLLMRNISREIAGAELYVFKKRGIFKSTAVRAKRPAGEGVAARAELRPGGLTEEEIQEVEYRLEALTPYLTAGL